MSLCNNITLVIYTFKTFNFTFNLRDIWFEMIFYSEISPFYFTLFYSFWQHGMSNASMHIHVWSLHAYVQTQTQRASRETAADATPSNIQTKPYFLFSGGRLLSLLADVHQHPKRAFIFCELSKTKRKPCPSADFVIYVNTFNWNGIRLLCKRQSSRTTFEWTKNNQANSIKTTFKIKSTQHLDLDENRKERNTKSTAC